MRHRRGTGTWGRYGPGPDSRPNTDHRGSRRTPWSSPSSSCKAGKARPASRRRKLAATPSRRSAPSPASPPPGSIPSCGRCGPAPCAASGPSAVARGPSSARRFPSYRRQRRPGRGTPPPDGGAGHRPAASARGPPPRRTWPSCTTARCASMTSKRVSSAMRCSSAMSSTSRYSGPRRTRVGRGSRPRFPAKGPGPPPCSATPSLAWSACLRSPRRRSPTSGIGSPGPSGRGGAPGQRPSPRGPHPSRPWPPGCAQPVYRPTALSSSEDGSSKSCASATTSSHPWDRRSSPASPRRCCVTPASPPTGWGPTASGRGGRSACSSSRATAPRCRWCCATARRNPLMRISSTLLA